MSAVFDLTNKYWRLDTSGPPEIWQDHHISRTGGPMVYCLEMSISSPALYWNGQLVWTPALGLYLCVDPRHVERRVTKLRQIVIERRVT